MCTLLWLTGLISLESKGEKISNSALPASQMLKTLFLSFLLPELSLSGLGAFTNLPRRGAQQSS